ncbi:amidohydrolase [Leucobacter allii]|uniref:amidohydrolase n=1 Tax=Leucobacter allii TaxID=2932247 RepID=UPI001FD5CCBA|nr:amidohydrolase [Leucobacter allii]UOR00465.1 amidohydrolase [Leucobacter allii]
MTQALPADLCIVSGRVFDGRVRTGGTAVAVRGERIVAVGDDARILALRGPATRVIDARGGLIAPGFVDAHVHAAFAGVERLSLDLSGARDVEETLALIARATAAAPPGEWLTGGGWSHELFPHPTRAVLDEIAPDRPVALSDAGHHTLWANSRALALAGITRDTPQPRNGRVHTDASGEPTGYLNETAAELVGRVIPPAGEDEIVAGLLNAQDHLWSLGITGWHEAILGEYNGKADCSAAYVRSIREGTLPSRVSGALWIAPGLRGAEVPGLVERFIRLRAEHAAAGFATGTAKAMIDGVPHGGTAALLEPYCAHGDVDASEAGAAGDAGGAGDVGELHFEEEAIREFVTRLDAAGFALHLHVMGDRGVRVALDAIEAARAANGPGPRHHIAHLSMIHPEDAARFGPLGVTANMQALWAAPDPHVVPMIGEERMRRGYPFRALADGGADLAMGSDWPVSPPDPWLAIHVAVNRSLPEPPGEAGAAEGAAAPESSREAPGGGSEAPGDAPDVLDAGQALTLAEALAAYTSGSAELVLGDSGRVRVGERADLAIADRDPFAGPREAIIATRNVCTVVAGRVVAGDPDPSAAPAPPAG